MTVAIRPEQRGDADSIRALTAAAFEGRAYSDGSEPAIVDRLRADGDLALSLVALDQLQLVGHIAFSPLTLSNGAAQWFGLGPVSVTPALQRSGIGSSLIRRGIEELKHKDAHGIVLLGDPGYYARFGFRAVPQLTYPGPPPEYFQALLLAGEWPCGVVRYAAAFG